METPLKAYPPGYTGDAYPEVFTTPPPQPKEKKPGQLTPEQLKKYYEDGYLVVEGFFTPEEIAPYQKGCADLTEEVAQKLYKAGKITDLHSELSYEKRLLALEKDCPGAVMMVLKYGKLPEAFCKLMVEEKLMNAIEQFIGPEIAANPIWNTRPKITNHGETHVPWHQDSAYFDLESYSNFVATAWIAFRDATEDNGCLRFCRGGHKKGLICMHECCETLYLFLPEEEMVKRLGVDPSKDFIPAPVKAGGVVFFNNAVPHHSLPNNSDEIRWAMDLRYQSPQKPWGFFGLKQGILLRSPDQPDLVPDFHFFNSQDRYELQKEYEIQKTGQGKVDDFDPTISGHWMEKWHVTHNHNNIHLDQFFADKKKKQEEEDAAAKEKTI